MAYDENGFASVEQWLVNASPGTELSHAVLDRETVLFRAHEPRVGAACYELEISREAFEDHTVEIVLADLTRHKVADRLRADPTMRLNYTRDRNVPHLETLWVTCDERQYRVVRDSDHNVRIFDTPGLFALHVFRESFGVRAAYGHPSAAKTPYPSCNARVIFISANPDV